MNISSPIEAPAKWMETFARIGLSAKGIVYCISGILAFMAAFRLGNATEKDASKQQLFKTIEDQPFGMVLIVAIAIGLIFFCIWRFFQAIKDTEDKGADVKGLGKRFAYFSSGITYSGLAYYVIKVIFKKPQSSGGGKKQEMFQSIVDTSWGPWLITVLALILVGVGVYQVYFSLSGKYKKHIEETKIKKDYKTVLLRTGRIGYVARGVVWLILAWIFVKGAFNNNVQQVKGASTAFTWLKTSPYGSFLLGAMAIGLFCYGVFMFVRARYQPIGYS